MSDEIRKLFNKAAIQNERTKYLSGSDWAEYRRIEEGYADRVRVETRIYEHEYQDRFEAERKRIIDKGGAKDLNFVHRWFGRDKFNSAVIDREADQAVRMAHDQHLLKLQERKEQELDKLFEFGEYRETVREKIKTDFRNATNRRSGQERRRPRSR